MNTAAWRLTVSAAALMAIAMGSRSSSGLFVSALNTASGLGLTSLSLALALGQLGVGVAQPVIGVVADRYGAARVIVTGALLLAIATALPAAWPAPPVVLLALVASAVAGSAVGSNGLLLGQVGRAVSAARAGTAASVVGAGGSAGQLLMGPSMQWIIDQRGWIVASVVMATLTLLALPIALGFRRRAAPAAGPESLVQPSPPAQPLRDVLRRPQFQRVAASFAVCGFHVAFLGVHMPGVIERCGLPASLAGTWIAVAGAANIAGTIAIGLALKRHDAGALLAGLYLTRALGIAALLVLPVTPMLMLGFALVMGASQMATLAPTTQLIARHHGVHRLGTLIGFLMLAHQVGSFAGVWLGGWAAAITGSDSALWTLDTGLALMAAALVWPRRNASATAADSAHARQWRHENPSPPAIPR